MPDYPNMKPVFRNRTTSTIRELPDGVETRGQSNLPETISHAQIKAACDEKWQQSASVRNPSEGEPRPTPAQVVQTYKYRG